MVAAVVPERARWAVDRCGIGPDDRVLEIGCGNGAALSLIADRLVRGVVVGIDRSATAVERASHRNAAMIDTGRVEVRRIELLDLAPQPTFDRAFDVVLAIDVNAFTRPCVTELAVVRSVLIPDGRLHLVHRPPDPAKVDPIARHLSSVLPDNGFAVEDVVVAELAEGRIVGVAGRLAD